MTPDRRSSVQGHPEGVLHSGPSEARPLAGQATPSSSRSSAAATSAASPPSATWRRRSAAPRCSGCAVGEATPAEPAPLKPVAAPGHPGGPPDPRRGPALRGGRPAEGDRSGCARTTSSMKVSDTEWQWDRNKLTIYFTAEKRVDFRALVRDLASTFRTRIELRQIGVRDEAARLSRRRPLRPRVLLLHLAHRAVARSTSAWPRTSTSRSTRPRSPAGAAACSAASSTSTISTSPPGSASPRRGRRSGPRSAPEKVIAVDIFRERVFLRSEEHGPRIIPLVQLREEVEQLGDVLVTAGARAPAWRSTAPRRPGVTRSTSSRSTSRGDGGTHRARRAGPRAAPAATARGRSGGTRWPEAGTVPLSSVDGTDLSRPP